MSSNNIDIPAEAIPEPDPEPPVPQVKRMRGPGKKEIKLTHDPEYSKTYWREKFY